VSDVVAFLFGMITMGYLLAALFFAKFWRGTRDPLFASFSVAFGLLAVNQAIPTLIAVPREELTLTYLLRLGAFALIAIAIIYKNATGKSNG
jgi:hypothetical protein